MRRRDDIKVDYTSRLDSVIPTDQIGLLAPWDRRSMCWSAAPDMRSAADACELASRLIPPPETGNAQFEAVD